MIAIMVTHPGWWLVVWLIFLAAYCFGATMQRGSNYSRGWEAGYLKAMADIEEEQADGREIIPAEGSPFVREIRTPHADALEVVIPAGRAESLNTH